MAECDIKYFSLPFNALNKLNTKFDKFWIANYFEKTFGESSEYGKLVANIRWQRYDTHYFSSYEEFAGKEGEDAPLVDSQSAYRTRLDAVFGEIEYLFPVKSWGQLYYSLYDTYKHSVYLDSQLPLDQKTNIFGTAFGYFGHKGKLYYNARVGLEGTHTRSSNMAKSYNMWIPSPGLG